MTANNSCCSSDASAPEASSAGGGATVVYTVTGMTCGHCEKAVNEELSALPGVTAVQADAKTGRVTVTATAPLDEDAVRAAIDEAGYELTGQI